MSMNFISFQCPQSSCLIPEILCVVKNVLSMLVIYFQESCTLQAFSLREGVFAEFSLNPSGEVPVGTIWPVPDLATRRIVRCSGHCQFKYADTHLFPSCGFSIELLSYHDLNRACLKLFGLPSEESLLPLSHSFNF